MLCSSGILQYWGKWIDSRRPFYLFLGEQPQALVAKIDPQLKKVAAAHRPFVLSLWRGVFPSWKNPRVPRRGAGTGRVMLGPP